jgi:hypothetical protein
MISEQEGRPVSTGDVSVLQVGFPGAAGGERRAHVGDRWGSHSTSG